MSNPVNLDRLAEEILVTPDEMVSFLDLETGEFYNFPEEIFKIAEEGEDPDFLEDWESEMVFEARKAIEDEERYVELPDRYEINEGGIAIEFCNNFEDEEYCRSLAESVDSKGTGRKFKDLLRDKDAEKDWYAFRHSRVKELLREWCTENGLDCEEIS